MFTLSSLSEKHMRNFGANLRAYSYFLFLKNGMNAIKFHNICKAVCSQLHVITLWYDETHNQMYTSRNTIEICTALLDKYKVSKYLEIIFWQTHSLVNDEIKIRERLVGGK